MLKKMNFRSKKGISLAVALTICLFLVLVTGGITTVAVLQHKETGSSMNSRQAYISAKSGLDAMQDALENKIVTSLPGSIGDEYAEYCVLYYDATSGELKSSPINVNPGDDIASIVSERIKLLKEDGHEIVGGDGTYFKITNKDGKKYNVTALNTTGKFNDDLTLNRGDLSFDVVKIQTYTFTLDPTAEPTEPTGSTDINTGGLHNRFMLVGQQTCLNELNGSNGNQSTGRTLNQDFVDKENGSNWRLFDGVCYLPYNENGGDYAFTYFPIVYDKFVKLTSSHDRVAIKVVDEGIYLVGSANGKIVNKFIDPERNKGVGAVTSFGEVSFLNNNPEYGETFECNFLCIKENVVVRKHEGGSGADLKVQYCGTEGLDYVVVNIPGPDPVYFYSVTEGGQNTDAGHVYNHFKIDPGYYKLPNGSVLNDLSSWKDASGNLRSLPEEEKAIWVERNMYSTIMSYVASGQIHTGSNETSYSDSALSEGNRNVNVKIVDNNGAYILGASGESGYSTSEIFVPEYNLRDDYNIFFSPNYPITNQGYYHWYCGKTLNFQWCRNASTPLSVVGGAHVKMSAATTILTIGPDVKTADGASVSVSKDIKGDAGSSWTISGPNGTGSTDLYVMTNFNVTYAGGSYEVQAGHYVNVPSTGVNLFSVDGENYFRYTSEIRSMADYDVYVKYPTNVPSDNPTENPTPPTTDNTNTSQTAFTSESTNSAVMPASVSANTVRTLSLFNRTRNVIALSPMSTTFLVEDNPEDGLGSETIEGAETQGRTEIIAEYELEHLYFKDNDVEDGYFNIPVTDTLKIQRQIAPNETTDIIIFEGEAGRSFRIPYSLNDEGKLDLFEPSVIATRARAQTSDDPENVVTEGEEGPNYTFKASDEQIRVIKKYY